MRDLETMTVFHYVTGAGSCRRAPEISRALIAHKLELFSVLTPNVSMVLEPESLLEMPGNHWIEDYGQPPLEIFPFGTMLVAPCTFNTLNKLVAGIADNLVTAMLGDAIGAGCPTVIAPGMNAGQWANPRVVESVDTLRKWGCSIVEPVTSMGRLSLASTPAIVDATLAVCR